MKITEIQAETVSLKTLRNIVLVKGPFKLMWGNKELTEIKEVSIDYSKDTFNDYNFAKNIYKLKPEPIVFENINVKKENLKVLLPHYEI